MIFHIRKPLRRRGGSQYYRDRGEREVGTLCGAPPTAFDVANRAAAVPWEAHIPCQECLSARNLDWY